MLSVVIEMSEGDSCGNSSAASTAFTALSYHRSLASFSLLLFIYLLIQSQKLRSCSIFTAHLIFLDPPCDTTAKMPGSSASSIDKIPADKSIYVGSDEASGYVKFAGSEVSLFITFHKPTQFAVSLSVLTISTELNWL